MTKLRAVKGMNDLLPEELGRWRRLESIFRETAERYGFGEIRTPLLEPTELFVRSIGEATDIVEKEMYTFHDKGEKNLTLRPEGTASCARAYLEHTVGAREAITRWYYLGPMFRRERPTRGRYRQFHQAGVEVYGDPGPFIDAEIIDMLVRFLSELGIVDLRVLLNSLGDQETRQNYREALIRYLEPHRGSLSADSQRRLETNPLRILDSKAPEDQAIIEDAPSILEHLSEEDQAHFDGVRRTLDRLGTPYEIEPRLVRGLDYYSRTLFEVQGRGGELGAQNALAGGGRYDGMIEELGGKATPAFGFALGIERLLLAMGEAEDESRPRVMILAANDEARVEAVALARELRDAGFNIETDLRGTSLKSQLRRADRSGAALAFILGDDELARGVVQWKRLEGEGSGESPREGIASVVAELLGQKVG
ncbi:MAG: histidine--tRNA ligase [Sandaracinaceae bacterium]|nr:histidine--tRNA ligase [Sandaracinaceae bacterium]